MTTDTKTVARYRAKLSYGLIEVEPHPAGSFVLFTDHERVVGELEARIITGGAISGAAMGQITKLAIERDTLRAALAASRADVHRLTKVVESYRQQKVSIDDAMEKGNV